MLGLNSYASSDEEDEAQNEVDDVSVQYTELHEGRDHY
jgi:hypothetical protein